MEYLLSVCTKEDEKPSGGVREELTVAEEVPVPEASRGGRCCRGFEAGLSSAPN